MNIAIERTSYGRAEREWLDVTGKHYLQNAPPGCLFAVSVRAAATGLLGEPIGQGPLLGLCLVGRPVARRLDQTGAVGEVTRMVLVPGLPHGAASAVLRFAAALAKARGMTRLIAYHDRTRHTGCIYRKAGFKRDGGTPAKPAAWASRGGRVSGTYEPTAKRRWSLALSEAA